MFAGPLIDKLLLEPNLLLPGLKPIGAVELDRTHPYYPNKLCMIFNANPSSNIEHVSGYPPTVTSQDLMSPVTTTDGTVLSVSYSTSFKPRYSIQPFNLTSDEPWEITFRAKTISGDDWGIFCGDDSNTNDFVAFNETGFFRLRNSSGTSYDFTGLSSFESDIKTYTLTSDGAGTGLCTLRLYIDDALAGTKTSVTSTLSMTDVLSAYSGTNAFSFHGEASHFRVSTGRHYSAGDVRNLQADLYGVFAPSGAVAFSTAVVGGVTIPVINNHLRNQGIM